MIADIAVEEKVNRQEKIKRYGLPCGLLKSQTSSMMLQWFVTQCCVLVEVCDMHMIADSHLRPFYLAHSLFPLLTFE